MIYPKDPYYLNADLVNKKQSGEPIHDEGFYEMVELLQDNGEPVYEVGIDFGQRLLFLEKLVPVVGGVEFDPNFGLYDKHSKMLDKRENGNNWDIKFISLEYWNPIKRDVVFTNHLLDILDEETRKEVLEKLLKTSKKLYLNENLELELPKRGNIYVVINEPGDDIKTNPKHEVEPELPSFESSKNRPKRSRKSKRDVSSDVPETETDDSSSSV